MKTQGKTNPNALGAGVRYTHTLKSWMSCYFHTTLQLHNSPANCARKLFKPSKDAATFLDCIKKLESFRFGFYVGDIISVVGFRPFWPRLPGPGANCSREFFTQVFMGN